jgi:hypothetical protein
LSQGRIGIFNRAGIQFFYNIMYESSQVILGDIFINGFGKQHDLILPVRLEFRHLWTSLSVYSIITKMPFISLFSVILLGYSRSAC